MRKQEDIPLHCFDFQNICSIQFDRKDIAMNKMIVTTLDGKFYIFDMRTFHPTRGYSHSVKKVRVYIYIM